MYRQKNGKIEKETFNAGDCVGISPLFQGLLYFFTACVCDIMVQTVQTFKKLGFEFYFGLQF